MRPSSSKTLFTPSQARGCLVLLYIEPNLLPVALCANGDNLDRKPLAGDRGGLWLVKELLLCPILRAFILKEDGHRLGKKKMNIMQMQKLSPNQHRPKEIYQPSGC